MTQLAATIGVLRPYLHVHFHCFLVKWNVNKLHPKVMCCFVKGCMGAHRCKAAPESTRMTNAETLELFQWMNTQHVRRAAFFKIRFRQTSSFNLVLHFRVFDATFIRHVSVSFAGHQNAFSSP